MKALGILVILFNSIFAGEAKSDSSLLKLLNSLKRQKIFYSSASENWIPPTLPSDCCVSGGCCLFPVAAFTMHKISKADTIHKDTTFEKKYRWSIGIGYTGGICYTGKDLMKYLGDMTFDPIELILARLYWLNSLEASISHFPNKKWGVEVGGGYGWTQIEKHSSLSYQFELYPLWLGWLRNKHTIKISYIYARSTKITKGERINYCYGKGDGVKITYVYCINKLLTLNYKVGQISYIILEKGVEYKIDQPITGIGLSIGYKF